ncbi:hypothetical protein BIW11_02864 [Tropilaelaps mercedesae]|uniref:Uncharacterized protein n=1 Tax=Tropilaelaps mercedesae TaxID=418985 RepID=A0A1V9XW48_9ACAR|nr:hypothetical protein BIW11_02864 [Tropilaelaps mercedesae]
MATGSGGTTMHESHLEAAATYHHQQLQRGRGGGHGPGKEQRFGKHYGGQSSRLQHIPLQESRVEVRIDDYRRDQRAINHAIRLQHGGQHHQQGSDQHQQHFDRDSGESWKNHPGQRSAGANDIIQNKNRPFEGSITGQVSDTDSEEGASCGPRSPCLEPNGLFPLNGNCCGFVSCANCRPYTQRAALGVHKITPAQTGHRIIKDNCTMGHHIKIHRTRIRHIKVDITYLISAVTMAEALKGIEDPAGSMHQPQK